MTMSQWGSGTPEPISRVAPPLPTRAILSQRWGNVSFLHWRVPAADVQPLLPDGTTPDVFDGTSWVGLIGFRMSRFAVLPGPSLPYVGDFPEINVRLYSVDERGRRAVVFRSLEATRLLTVLGARAALAVPYEWARMSMVSSAAGGDLRFGYRSRRLTGHHPSTRMIVRPTSAPPPEAALADFLTARWAMHTSLRGVTRFVPNEHGPWPLRSAELVSLDDQLVAAAGLAGVALRAPDSVLFSPGVDVLIGAPLPPGA